NGYFDKLLIAPIRRSSIIFGRLAADFARGIGTASLVLLIGLALGARMESGVLGALALILLAALWGVAYAGIGLLVALYTRFVRAAVAPDQAGMPSVGWLATHGSMPAERTDVAIPPDYPSPHGDLRISDRSARPGRTSLETLPR